MSDELSTIVIDNGSGSIKAGIAGNEHPSTVFPTVIGHSKFLDPKKVSRNNQVIGDEAIARVASLKLECPINHGIVTNWDDMETIWDFLFKNELRVDPSEYSILISETGLSPKVNREKIMQVMFETFNAKSFYINDQSLFSSYSSGRTTCIVLQVGESISIVNPIYEGKIEQQGYRKVNYAGRDVNEYLIRILTESGHFFSTSEEKEMARDIKEKYGYVALDYDHEIQKSSELDVSYNTCHGENITISSERFRCTEVLFKPHFIQKEEDGIDRILFDSILSTDEYVQRDLFANIVVSGGSTLFKGFSERIQQEIERLALSYNPISKIKVVAAPDRKYSTWIGGSIYASLTTYPQKAIAHEEYDDAGPGIVHRKCF